MVIQEDSSFDKWIRRQYLKGGLAGEKYGVKDLELSQDIVIHGDSIIQVNYSNDTKKIQDEIYSRISDVSGLFKEFISQNTKNKKVEIEVTIIKNPQLTWNMKNQLINKFFKDFKLV